MENNETNLQKPGFWRLVGAYAVDFIIFMLLGGVWWLFLYGVGSKMFEMMPGLERVCRDCMDIIIIGGGFGGSVFCFFPIDFSLYRNS